MIREALGRPPRGAVGVGARDARGRPAVVVVDPLAGGFPFPTLYWLVHPALCREIARIESTSHIKALEGQVACDEAFQERMREETKNYREKRWALLESLHPLDSIPRAYLTSLQTVGIGGLLNPRRIRCLHMHYAHYLAQGTNAVGERLEREFSLSSLLK